MKKLIVAMALALSFAAVSASAEVDNKRMKLEGTVKFTKTYTLTCMAIGCPESKPYFYVTLTDVRTEDGAFATNEMMVQSIMSKIGTHEKPDALSHLGVELHENDYVVFEADVKTWPGSDFYYVRQVHSITKK